MIKFRCEQCGKKLGVGDEYAGKRVRCSACQAAIKVPEPQVSLDDALMPEVDEPAASSRDMTSSRNASATSNVSSGGRIACPKCGASVNDGAAICVSCGHSFKHGVNVKTVARAKSAAQLTGKSVVALVGGAVIAVTVGFIWAAIVRYTGFEIGWAAWGVGLVVGVGVAALAQQQSDMLGIAAAGLAIVGLFFGKVLIIVWAFPVWVEKEIADTPFAYYGQTYAHMIEHREFSEPVLALLDRAEESEEELPDDLHEKIDNEVHARYQRFSEAERAAMVTNLAAQYLDILPFREKLKMTLSGWDALWIVLAVITAYKAGSGTASD